VQLPVKLAAAALAVGAIAGCSANAAAPPTSTAPKPAPSPRPHAVVQAVTPAATTSAPKPTTPPAFDPCATNSGGQLVYVSVARQHLWMCSGHGIVRDDPVTTGMVGEYTNTPTGTYAIQARDTDTTLTLNTGATYDVKYWIPFDAPLFGFHDSSWQTFPYGSQQYRTDGSHGCVHMPLADIAFLYRWAHVGTTVVIH
jgi:hypothetical protein